MQLSLLDKAGYALSRKRFAEVIMLLQPHIMEYDYSFRFFYLLATACLYQKDYKGARDYYKCARQIKPRDTDMILGNAILYLRRNDIPSAIDCYLEILEYNPDCRQAKKALNFLRRLESPEILQQHFDTGSVTAFYPPICFKKQGVLLRRKYAAIIGSVFLCGAVGAGGFMLYNRYHPRVLRADITISNLNDDDKQNVLELGGSYRYMLTESEVIKTFTAAQRCFQNYDDNNAQIYINRILSSNAAASIKRKARMLMDYFSIPGFDTVKTNITFADVSKDPYLYLDCAVIWSGRAANITPFNGVTEFDFLIGYEDRKNIEGIVSSRMTDPLFIDPELPLSVLARITLQDNKLLLDVISIHQAYQY